MDLSAAEFDLLKVFAERPGRVVSRDVLLDLLKGYERDPFDRTVDIRVGRLRRRSSPIQPILCISAPCAARDTRTQPARGDMS